MSSLDPAARRETVDCHEFCGDVLRPTSRELVGEEPLRIDVNGRPAATLMRTPGDDVELALGFLVTSGIITSMGDVDGAWVCDQAATPLPNVVQVRISSAAGVHPLPGNRTVFSSCSVCGDDMIAELAEGISRFDRPEGRLTPADIFGLSAVMGSAQKAFRRTGGSHAAALSGVPVHRNGSGSVVMEDLGRHNALDKVVGAALRREIDRGRCLLMLSGRASVEMIAKASRAGIADVAAVSAPSALAVRLARSLGMFLAGFVRGENMTVYAGPEALRCPSGGAES